MTLSGSGDRKIAETDVSGTLIYELAHVTIAAHVIMECKNYSNPLVLIGSKDDREALPIDTVQVTFDPLDFKFPSSSGRSILTKLGLRRARRDGQIGTFVGSQLVRMDRKSSKWTADNSSIYDGILYPLLKARQYEIKRNNESGSQFPWEHPWIFYYFPILLTAGEIHTVTVDGMNSPEVEAAKWAVLKRIFHSREAWASLYVDVVNFEFLEEYLHRRIIETVTYAYSILKDNSQMYDPEWLVDNYGLPAHDEFSDTYGPFPGEVVFEEWLNAIKAEKSRRPS